MLWKGKEGFLLASLEPKGAQSLNDVFGGHRKGAPSSIKKPIRILYSE